MQDHRFYYENFPDQKDYEDKTEVTLMMSDAQRDLIIEIFGNIQVFFDYSSETIKAMQFLEIAKTSKDMRRVVMKDGSVQGYSKKRHTKF